MDKITVAFTFLALLAVLCIGQFMQKWAAKSNKLIENMKAAVESKETLMCRCDTCKETNHTCITRTGACVFYIYRQENGVFKQRDCTIDEPGPAIVCDNYGYRLKKPKDPNYFVYCCFEDMCNTVDKTANITLPTAKPFVSHFSSKDSTDDSGAKPSIITIAAAVSGTTCVICALIMLSICWYKKRQLKKQKQLQAVQL